MNKDYGTGIWNSIKRNAKEPIVYGSAAIGVGIGIYQANTVEGIQGSGIQQGAAGALTGGVIGMGLKHLGERPDGLPYWR